jgi:hypothetical protein
MTTINENGEPQGPGYSGGPPETLAYRNPVGACFLYRRGVYESVGDYAEDLFLVEDWDYWIRIAKRFRIEPMPSDLYLFRRHGGSLTQRKWVEVQRAKGKMLQRHLPEMHWVSGRARSRGYLVAARIAWQFESRAKALALTGEALGYAPAYTFLRLMMSPLQRGLRRRRIATE